MSYTKDNPLRCFTAFAGYDSQILAFNELKKVHPEFEYEIIGWSEIDPYAIKAHNALFPEAKDLNFGDISKIDWSKVPDFDFFTYSSPCLTEDSLILTAEGYRRMSDVKVGDSVLTKSGEWHDVVKKFDNGLHSTCYLNALGFENIHCTLNHKFYVRHMSRVWVSGIRRYKRTFSEPEFKEAKDIVKNDYFGIPVDTRAELPKWDGVEDNRWGHHKICNKITHLLDNPSFWYLMGRYIGDGWKKVSHAGNGIIISCGGRYRKQLEDAIVSCGYSFHKSEERTADKYCICSNELNAFVDRFGYYAYGKRIDGDTMALPVNLLSSFLDGILESDGSYNGGEYKITTASRELAYGISFCVAKVYHRPCRIYKTNRSDKCVIEGRICNQRDTYQLTFSKESRKQDHAFYEDGYIWYPFRSRTEGEIENVYNMEVDIDHSYIVQGCISKNCQDFSNAGLQKGGTEGSGTRSSLLWECRRAIIAKRPKYAMMENVKALVSAKFKPTFNKWEQELASYGYNNYCKVLNAKDYGVPQNRERIFLVSILDEDQPFNFGEPFELTTRLKDVLEENVDEKYYLDDEKVAKFVEHCDKKQAEGCGFKFEPTTGGG